MNTRFVIGGSVFVGASLLLWEAFDQTLQGRASDLLLNLGTELLGIGITVLVIDLMLEKRRQNDEAKRIATNVLHDLDHHVWVWQGGARGFDLAELAALLDEANHESPLPSFTQNLFLTLGSRSNNTLRISAEAVAVSSELKEGLTTLSELSRMRDKEEHLPPSEIIATLKKSLPSLVRASGLSMPEPDRSAPLEYRGTSEEEQEWRHYGRR